MLLVHPRLPFKAGQVPQATETSTGKLSTVLLQEKNEIQALENLLALSSGKDRTAGN